jgi:hypothetical protein
MITKHQLLHILSLVSFIYPDADITAKEAQIIRSLRVY